MQVPEILSIRGNYAVIYNDTSYFSGNRHNLRLTENFKNIKTYSGDVTSHALKRIQKAVSILVQRSVKSTVFNPITNRNQNFQLGFLTLTIPDLTTLDQSFYYKILLKPYLRLLKNKFGLKNYVWKAELQKRGSIHYHLTIDKFIPLDRLRFLWNELLDKNGLMESYKKMFSSNNPNSIDIHSVKYIRNLTSYLTKYISKKSDDERKLKGKIWGCSDSLLGADFCKVEIDAETKIDINNAIKSRKATVLTLEKCAIIRLNSSFSWQSLSKKINVKYNNWLRNIQEIIPPKIENAVIVPIFIPPPKIIQSYLF